MISFFSSFSFSNTAMLVIMMAVINSFILSDILSASGNSIATPPPCPPRKTFGCEASDQQTCKISYSVVLKAPCAWAGNSCFPSGAQNCTVPLGEDPFNPFCFTNATAVSTCNSVTTHDKCVASYLATSLNKCKWDKGISGLDPPTQPLPKGKMCYFVKDEKTCITSYMIAPRIGIKVNCLWFDGQCSTAQDNYFGTCVTDPDYHCIPHNTTLSKNSTTQTKFTSSA